MKRVYTAAEERRFNYWVARLDILLRIRRERELERRSAQSPLAFLRLQAE